VTLLVTPDQAETLTLAGAEGRIQLVLRNGGDQTIERTFGRVTGELFNSARKQRPDSSEAARRPRPKPVAVAVAPPPPPPKPAPPDEVMVIRGTTKTVEIVGFNRPGETRKNP
jgi:Flp pilus assembly protein CpaB